MLRILGGMPYLQLILRTSVTALACLSITAMAGQERTDGGNSAEKKYLIKMETTQHKLYCQARIALEYTQRNTVASVTGEIENDDCGASGGDYTMTVRFRDENGEVQNEEHEEQWQRDDDQVFAFEYEYTIGDNVDLIRVRARKIQCVCAEMPADDEAEETKGEIE